MILVAGELTTPPEPLFTDPAPPLDPAVTVVDGVLHLPGGPIATFSDLGEVRTVDLDGDGVVEVVLTHPSFRLLGIVELDGAAERSYPLPFAPTRLAVDDQGVLWVADASQALPFRLAQASEPPVAPPPAAIVGEPLGWSKRPAELGGVRVGLGGFRFPEFAGTAGTLASGRGPSDLLVTGSLGLATAAILGPGRGIGGSVMAAAAMEHRSAAGRLWFGLDSAPLLLQAGNTTFWHLGLVSGGVGWGSPHVRGGPFAAIGLVGAGAGWRVLFQPFEQPSGALHGLEARLAVFLGPTVTDEPVEPVGQAMLAWSTSFQLGRSAGRWDPAPVSAPTGGPRSGPTICRRFSATIGGEVGVSSTELSWEHVGDGVAWDTTGSPEVALACETGGAHAGFVVSGETAPWLSYRIPMPRQGTDRTVFRMGSATLGPVFGGDVARIGPFLTAGIWTLGGGVRALLTPVVSDRGVHHGLELRGTAFYPSAPSFGAMLGYVAWFDPRRGANER